jgi:hypothetical protein
VAAGKLPKIFPLHPSKVTGDSPTRSGFDVGSAALVLLGATAEQLLEIAEHGNESDLYHFDRKLASLADNDSQKIASLAVVSGSRSDWVLTVSSRFTTPS